MVNPMQLQSTKPFAVIGMALRDPAGEPLPEPALLTALVGCPRDVAHPRLLRCVWEALEDARIVPSQLRGAPVTLLLADGADEVRRAFGLAADVDDPQPVLAGGRMASCAARAQPRIVRRSIYPMYCRRGAGADAEPGIARLVRPAPAPMSPARSPSALPRPGRPRRTQNRPLLPPWVLSAPTPQGVAARAADLRDLLTASTSIPRDADLGWSLGVHPGSVSAASRDLRR